MQLSVRQPLAGQAIFSLDGLQVTWAEAVALGSGYGAWDELAATARQGLACEARLAAADEVLDPRQISEAAKRFRYARSLLAGDEMRHWLERWRLTESEWRGHIRRTLLVERWSGELAETLGRFPVDDSEVEGVLWPDAVCSGLLTRIAVRLAADAALALAAEEPFTLDLPRLRTAAAGARAAAATEVAIEHEVANHRLEWIHVEGELLVVSSVDAAREAALCIRDDARPLAEVAAECGTGAMPLRAFVADLDPALATALVAARAGELIGPVACNGGYAVARLDAKAAPNAGLPNVRLRAETRIGDKLAERALRDHVVWHERD